MGRFTLPKVMDEPVPPPPTLPPGLLEVESTSASCHVQSILVFMSHVLQAPRTPPIPVCQPHILCSHLLHTGDFLPVPSGLNQGPDLLSLSF